MGFFDYAQDDTVRKGGPSISLTLHSGRHGKSARKADRQTARRCRPAQRVLNCTQKAGQYIAPAFKFFINLLFFITLQWHRGWPFPKN